MPSVRVLPEGFTRDTLRPVNQGDCLVSSSPTVVLSTILGSCISACVRDTLAAVGGMNHFLLAAPTGAGSDRYGAPARYGAYAMELLINRVLTAGTGRKSNLEIKVFGGGMTSTALSDVGMRNIRFLRQFLADEGYAAGAEDLGGPFARRILFKPSSGQAFVKRLAGNEIERVLQSELAIARRMPGRKTTGPEVELF